MQRICTDQRLKRRTASLSRKDGLTLVEVMMAFTVLVFGILCCLGSMQKMLTTLDTARCSTLAAQIMQSQVETLRLKNWNGIASVPTGEVPKTELRKLVPPSAEPIVDRFTLTQTLTPVSSYTDKDGSTVSMMAIDLTVTWRGHGNINHSRTFKARYAKEGLYNYYATAR